MHMGTILVIDDEAAVRDLARAALERWSFRVITAERGEQAVELARETPEIALVLLDMTMPGMSGREIVEALQAIRPDLPVMISSGYSESEIHHQFAGLAIAGALEKPFTINRLVEKVNATLRRAASA